MQSQGYNRVPPPSSNVQIARPLNKSRFTSSSSSIVSSQAAFATKQKNYFDEDDDDDDNDVGVYHSQPASTQPIDKVTDDEYDPLEAFM